MWVSADTALELVRVTVLAGGLHKYCTSDAHTITVLGASGYCFYTIMLWVSLPEYLQSSCSQEHESVANYKAAISA